MASEVLDGRSRLYEMYLSPAPGPSRIKYLERLIREHFPKEKGSSILELGCGSGNLIGLLLQAGYKDVIGIDRSPTQLEVAKQLFPANVREGDMQVLLRALPDASQDVVVSIDVIEHLTLEELLDLALEVGRVLRTGGRWIVETANAESPFSSRVRYADLTHCRSFTRHAIFHLAKYAGFAHSRCFELAPRPAGFVGILRWCMWRIIRAGCMLWIAIETGSVEKRGVFTQNMLAVIFK